VRHARDARVSRAVSDNRSLCAGNRTVYYLPLTTGWSNNFAGATTMFWSPPLPALGVAFICVQITNAPSPAFFRLQ